MLCRDVFVSTWLYFALGSLQHSCARNCEHSLNQGLGIAAVVSICALEAGLAAPRDLTIEWHSIVPPTIASSHS